MSRMHVISVIFGLFAVGLRGAEIGVAFTGYIKDSKEVRFTLKNVATGSSGWVAIGQTFDGYTVRQFDDSTETLVVERDGTKVHLRLVAAKMKSGTGEPPQETKQRVLRNLRMLAAAADQFYLENGVTRATYGDLVGPTKYVKEIVPVDGESYQSIQFAQGRDIQVQTREGYTISYRP